MPAQDHLLQKAISFYRAGDCDTARRLLLGILRADESSQAAWIWYAETYPTPQERLKIFAGVLSRHPRMLQVRQAYEVLQQSLPAQDESRTPMRQYQTVTVAPTVRLMPQTPAPRTAAPRTAETARPAAPTARPKARPAAQAARIVHPARRVRPAWTVISVMMILALLASTLFFRSQAAVEVSRAAALEQENARVRTNYELTVLDLTQVKQNLTNLQSAYQGLSEQNADLSKRFDGLTAQHSTLTAAHQKLQGEHTTLKTEHQQLVDAHAALNANFQNLQNEYQALNQNYNTLGSQHRDLESRYAALTSSYTDLSSKAVVPPYITVHEREVTLAFYKRDGSMLYWNVPFENLEKDIVRGNTSRSVPFALAPKVSMDTADHKGPYIFLDDRTYVDAHVFGKVIPDLYDQAESEDAFIREVWNIVAQLTTYASDPKVDTPRYPLETLLAGGGDCEDTAILFASMLKAAPVNWKISLFYMNGDHPWDRTDPNHVAVLVEMGSTYYLVETTSKVEMTPYTDGFNGWAFAIQ